MMMRFFLHLEITGLEHLQSLKDRPVILASNHIHEFDPAFIPSAIPQRILGSPVFFVSLAKKHYENSGLGWRTHIYGGLFFTSFGAHPVYKGTGDYEKALVNHIRIINDGGTVYIFPEGKRSRTGEIEGARGGVSYLAWKTNTPIIPIYIDGVHDMGLKEFLLRKRKITINIGRPLTKEDLGLQEEDPSPDDHKSAAKKIMNIVANLKR